MAESPAVKGAVRLLVAGMACWLLAGAPSAAAKTRVVFTVDVESNERFQLPDQIDAVCQGGVACGLMEMVRLLQARRWPATFFLDVYEHRQWGAAAMRNIALRLQDAGQDVALHTHPHWAYDPARWAMYQYTLDEQTTIVRDGSRLLQEWTGRPVVAHRAGAYTADEQTLIALQRNGVLIDSSLLWQYPHNRLGPLNLPHNQPSRYAGVVEIPVTAYHRDERPGALPRVLGASTTVRKIDPNWFLDAEEAKGAIDGALAANVPVLVVFLHSFSFMAATPAGPIPAADRHAFDMFQVISDQVASHGLPVVTMRDLAADMPAVPSSAADIVPVVAVRVDFAHYTWHRLQALDRRALIAGVGLVVMLGAVPILVVLVRARRRAPRTRTEPQGGALQTAARVRVR